MSGNLNLKKKNLKIRKQFSIKFLRNILNLLLILRITLKKSRIFITLNLRNPRRFNIIIKNILKTNPFKKIMPHNTLPILIKKRLYSPI